MHIFIHKKININNSNNKNNYYYYYYTHRPQDGSFFSPFLSLKGNCRSKLPERTLKFWSKWNDPIPPFHVIKYLWVDNTRCCVFLSCTDDPGFLKYTRKYIVPSLHHHNTHTHTLTTTLSPPATLAGWIYDIISLKY